MSTASTIIDRAQQFVNEGQPYTFGGKNEPMNKGKKSHVEWLKQTYGSGSGHYGHILGDDQTLEGKNYKKYVNADSSPYVLIDCSGLTDVAFKAGGINIGAGSSVQNSNAAQKVGRIDPKKNPDAVKPGALLHRSGHVAVMGYDKKVIEAKGWKYGCVAGKTELSSFTSAYNLSGEDASAPQAEKQEPAKVIGKATVINVSAYLNVRPEAGTAKAAIGKLYNGNQVDVTGEAGDWYQINYNGKSAYISKKYAQMSTASEPAKTNENVANSSEAEAEGSSEVKPETTEQPTSSTSKAYVTCDVLNVRSGAGATNNKIGTVTKGTELKVSGESNGWLKIEYGSDTGWVCKDYTSTKAPASNSDSGNSGGAVSASGVPVYAQGDSRWGTDKMGKSGKTIHQIGCAMTSTTMTLNKTAGQSFTPKDMNSYLNNNGGYTDSGCIYWGTAAKYASKSYTGKSYTRNIVDGELNAGRPVVISVKSAGHWVCVAGRKTDGNYIIHDPAGGKVLDGKWNNTYIAVDGYTAGYDLRTFG